MNPPESIQGFLYQLKRIKDNKRKAINLLLEEIQKDITQQEAFIQEQNVQMKEAESLLNNLKDCLQVFKVAQAMIPQLHDQFGGAKGNGDVADTGNSINNRMDKDELMNEQKSINIQHIAGVVERAEDVSRLQRLIFRSTKGKSYVFVREYHDPETQKPRSVYIIVFWDGHHVRERIQKICDSFTGQRYEIPSMEDLPAQI